MKQLCRKAAAQRFVVEAEREPCHGDDQDEKADADGPCLGEGESTLMHIAI